jgi:hypothetical protein
MKTKYVHQRWRHWTHGVGANVLPCCDTSLKWTFLSCTSGLSLTRGAINVLLRRVRLSLLPSKSNKYYLMVCVCMRTRVCVRACGYPGAWACACAYVHVALLIQHATLMRHIVTSFVAPPAPPYFSTLSHKWCDFRKNVIYYKMCVLIFSTTFV